MTPTKVGGLESEIQPELAQNEPTEDLTVKTTDSWDMANCEQYVPLLEQYDWDVDIAKNIMFAESGCNPTADNTTDVHRVWETGEVICVGSHGLMQIACPSGVLHDPAENIRVAYEEKYSTKRGWGHWSVCTKGLVDCGI